MGFSALQNITRLKKWASLQEGGRLSEKNGLLCKEVDVFLKKMSFSARRWTSF
jgi:hypothetical protein